MHEDIIHPGFHCVSSRLHTLPIENTPIPAFPLRGGKEKRFPPHSRGRARVGVNTQGMAGSIIRSTTPSPPFPFQGEGAKVQTDNIGNRLNRKHR